MIITLKDGSTKEYSEPKSIIEIAADISEGLARMACAGEVNGEVEDLRTVIDKDCNLSILTFNDEGGKAAFRHTTSHIMAQAIKRLYPETKLAIGPSRIFLFQLHGLSCIGQFRAYQICQYGFQEAVRLLPVKGLLAHEPSEGKGYAEVFQKCSVNE